MPNMPSMNKFTADVMRPDDKLQQEIKRLQSELDAADKLLQETQVIINQSASAIVEICGELAELTQSNEAMRLHCKVLNAQLKAAERENDRLRQLTQWKV